MTEDTIQERKNKIKTWLKNPNHLLLLALLIFALTIRLYYFTLTTNQAVWWDEGEYMLKAKNIAFGTPETGWSAEVRPILFSFISAVIFKLGMGETVIRFFLVILSGAGIFFVYLIGKKLWNTRIALIAAFLMSVFYIDIFYTTRLLVDVPQIFFISLAGLVFTKYYFDNGSRKLIFFILPIIALGTLVRFTVGLFAIILFIFLIAVDGLKLFRKKEWYVSLISAFAVFSPYAIYLWIKFHNPLYTLTQGVSSANDARGVGVTASDIFMQYIRYLPNYTPLIFFIIFCLGAIMALFYTAISIDKIRSNKSSQKYLFLLLWTIVPIIYFGFFVNHFEDRYLYMAFPAIFLISAFALDKLYSLIKPHSKIFAVLIIVALLAYGGWSSLQRSDALIKEKIPSYQGLKDAGLWLKSNSRPNEIVIAAGMPELTYYSERATYPYPINETDFLNFVKEKNASYMVLSVWEPSPQWTYNWPQNNQDKVEIVDVVFIDSTQKQISAVVYRFINKTI